MKYDELDAKLTIHVDFRPTLQYMDKILSLAASSFEKSYSNWVVRNNNADCTLFDMKRKQSLAILKNPQSGSITLVTKNKDTINNAMSEFMKIALALLKETDVKIVNRCSVRRQGLKATEKKYDDFVNDFYNLFYGSSKGCLNNFSADKVLDTVLILNGIKDGYENTVTLGALKEWGR